MLLLGRTCAESLRRLNPASHAGRFHRSSSGGRDYRTVRPSTETLGLQIDPMDSTWRGRARPGSNTPTAPHATPPSYAHAIMRPTALTGRRSHRGGFRAGVLVPDDGSTSAAAG